MSAAKNGLASSEHPTALQAIGPRLAAASDAVQQLVLLNLLNPPGVCSCTVARQARSWQHLLSSKLIVYQPKD
jgi:hypothetical protein